MNTGRPIAVDNTDWLKTIAIILVVVDHTGYFFIDDADWWSVVGRLAAPPFFFLLGYAQTRRIPLHWIWLAVALTVLDSWNAGWTWVAPNILLSFVLIRMARNRVQSLLLNRGWVAFVMLIALLIAVSPMTAQLVDYGSEGWLWALFGLCQRTYVDQRSRGEADRLASLLRLAACLVAAMLYAWQEQGEFGFSQLQLACFLTGLCILTLGLLMFRRGISGIQPPEFMAAGLHFIGRHTLEIYAIQLAGSEILILLIPDLAP